MENENEENNKNSSEYHAVEMVIRGQHICIKSKFTIKGIVILQY